MVREDDIACYTIEDLTNYQGYGVYQSGDFVENLGVKVARISAGTETPFGVIIRVATPAGATSPQSVMIRRRGPCPVVVSSAGLAHGSAVGFAAGGKAIAKVADKDKVMGTCTKGAAATDLAIAEVMLDGVSELSRT
jgi:hypothetical protein